DLGEEVDVAAKVEQAVVIAVEDGLLLLIRHRPFVEIGALVRLPALPVFSLHQAHRELVKMIALPRAFGSEDARAGDIVELGEIFVDVARAGHSPRAFSCASSRGKTR